MAKKKAEECSGGGVTILNTVVRKYLFWEDNIYTKS